MTTLFNVIVKTEGKNADADRSYTVHLDPQKSLKEARALLQGDLQVTGRWSFFASGAELTPSAEAVQTVDALIKSSKEARIVLHRVRPASERTPAELAELRKVEQDDEDRAEARRDREEAKLRAHAQRAMDSLTELQKGMTGPGAPLLDPNSVQVVFKEFQKATLMSAHGGKTGESLRDLDLKTIERVVRSLGLPRTTSRAPEDGTFMVNEIVARLRPEAGASVDDPSCEPVTTIASKYVVAVNEIETRVESFQEEWEKKAAESGFTQIAASMKVAYKSPAFKVAVAAKLEQTSKNESSAAHRDEVIYLVGIQEVRKARVHVPPEMIVLDRLVEQQFIEASTQGAEALKPLFDHHGYFVITEYTLGGKLYTSEKETRTGSSTAAASNFERQFGAALDASATFKGSVEAVGSHATVQQANASGSATRQSSNFHLSAKGGSVTDRNNPTLWTESLAPLNWEVISYGRLVPIYEFLQDREVRERCRTAVQALARASQDAELAERAGLERSTLEHWAVYSRGVDEQWRADWRRPPAIDTSNRHFRDHGFAAHCAWVEVPAGTYFSGARLYAHDDFLKIALFVTDSTGKKDREIKNPECSSSLPHRLDSGEAYVDTTKLFIPPGRRITAMRLAQLVHPSNRIGLELKLADLDGNNESLLLHHGDNNEYMVCDGSSRDIRPTYTPTMVPDGHMVAGIRLADIAHDHTMGFEIAVLPVS